MKPEPRLKESAKGVGDLGIQTSLLNHPRWAMGIAVGSGQEVAAPRGWAPAGDHRAIGITAPLSVDHAWPVKLPPTIMGFRHAIAGK
ncbi:hypothetical protein AMR42_13870 [Limnothrix sp. PR1529]|nr:hypothetical protein BCR12_15520 [Limnothrix sp. P13C2]PIB08184.1 hypothetical protein AMR42_13870 [Limnothrix sp. PR1529]